MSESWKKNRGPEGRKLMCSWEGHAALHADITASSGSKQGGWSCEAVMLSAALMLHRASHMPLSHMNKMQSWENHEKLYLSENIDLVAKSYSFKGNTQMKMKS